MKLFILVQETDLCHLPVMLCYSELFLWGDPEWYLFAWRAKQSIACQPLSRAWLFATPWTAAHRVPVSMRFSRQGYWSRLSFPSPGDLPSPGIEPGSPVLQTDSLLTELQGKPHVLSMDAFKWQNWASVARTVCSAKPKDLLNGLFGKQRAKHCSLAELP